MSQGIEMILLKVVKVIYQSVKNYKVSKHRRREVHNKANGTNSYISYEEANS